MGLLGLLGPLRLLGLLRLLGAPRAKASRRVCRVRPVRRVRPVCPVRRVCRVRRVLARLAGPAVSAQLATQRDASSQWGYWDTAQAPPQAAVPPRKSLFDTLVGT